VSGARSQFRGGVEPIFFGRSVWTASGLPQFISQRGNVSVPECGDAMCIFRLRMGVVFEHLAGMLMSGEVLAFSLLLASSMGMGADVVQFRGPLVIFVMRSVVITSGHD